jgi:hypothetical protein
VFPAAICPVQGYFSWGFESAVDSPWAIRYVCISFLIGKRLPNWERRSIRLCSQAFRLRARRTDRAWSANDFTSRPENIAALKVFHSRLKMFQDGF